MMGKCLWHEDTTPSMSMNVQRGLFHCHGCGIGGDIFEFWQRVTGADTFPAVLESLAQVVGVATEAGPPRRAAPVDLVDLAAAQEALEPAAPLIEHDPLVDERIVDTAHARLLSEPTAMTLLATRRGLVEETVRTWKLGKDNDRFYIPIRNAEGQCVNIRRYKFDAARAQDKMLSWRAGFGSARLWPLTAFAAADPIYLMEGEMDCLLALQCGLNAITCTGGASTWNRSWNERFAHREIVIVYDCDTAGRQGARRIAEELAPVAAAIRIVELGLTEPAGADFTDYIHALQNSIEQFRLLVDETPYFRLPTQPATIERAPRALRQLADAMNPALFGRPITSAFLCSGKDTQPYQVPKRMQIACGTNAGQHGKLCVGCPLAASDGAMEVEVECATFAEWLEFTRTEEERVQIKLRKKFRLPIRCPFVQLERRAVLNLEKVLMIPDIDHAVGALTEAGHSRQEATNEEAEYVTRVGWAFHEVPQPLGEDAPQRLQVLEANRNYAFTGYTVADPKTQAAVHLITRFQPAQTSLDAFTMQPEMVAGLRLFQPERPTREGIEAKLHAIYADFERTMAVYGRRDLMTAFDLAFHSVLTFDFQGQRLTRGWVETLCIGDTRTGKSKLVEQMVYHYQNGELTTGENTSFAGLVGGIDQNGTNYSVRWGKLPLNDRRLLVIDEAGSLPPEQIERMSGIRSSGRAEITKIHTERTRARTRAIWISNPRGNTSLASFTHGVLAVKALIGKPEDIARFDVILTAAARDVPQATINQDRERDAARIYTSELCRQRVMWAWTRKPEQVTWFPGTQAMLLRHALVQGARYQYANEIPLVEPNEHRIRLARLAVATACMLFSTTDGETVIVRPEHVEFVVAYLESIYRKPSLAFAEYAAQHERHHTLRDIATIETMLRPEGADEQLMSQEFFTASDMAEILGLREREQVRAAMASFRFCGFLTKRRDAYVKTPAAIHWLRERIEARRTASVIDAADAALPDDPDF